jgi:D-alanine-D-alanine ligase-like ATP-grasp enzyme
MPATWRKAPKDEYVIFETLKALGIAVAPFATAVSEVGVVGIPALVVGCNASGVHVRKMIARYGDIIPVISHTARTFPRFFMQRHIIGHEVACGVLRDGRNILPLVPVDAIPRSLHESGAWHMAPAVQDKVQALAKATHTAIGARGHSCVRMVVAGATPYVTGVDVNPSLAHTSLFMRSAKLTRLTEEEITESII